MSQSPISREAPTARVLTYQQVEEQFPDAWNAMPECYQNDSCLTFYMKGDRLSAEHDLCAETYVWIPGETIWLMVDP